MKINPKILSIPPFVSTSWKNVLSLHMEGSTLVIGLVSGSKIEVPELDAPLLEEVFAAHEKSLEQDTPKPAAKRNSKAAPFSAESFGSDAALLSFPLPLGLDGNMNNLLQHNPEASDSPDLPKDMLMKVGSLSKMIGIDDPNNLPKPEPHCNCMHCQIMRVMREGMEEGAAEEEQARALEEEEVTDEDLKFREWDIDQMGDKLYKVTNPLNLDENYTVFLGTPVGCTCGKENCEHIRSVLSS